MAKGRRTKNKATINQGTRLVIYIPPLFLGSCILPGTFGYWPSPLEAAQDYWRPPDRWGSIHLRNKERPERDAEHAHGVVPAIVERLAGKGVSVIAVSSALDSGITRIAAQPAKGNAYK
jgi:hypothetical protein